MLNANGLETGKASLVSTRGVFRGSGGDWIFGYAEGEGIVMLE